MDEKQPSRELLQRYLDGTCTDAERRRVDVWYQQLETNDQATVADHAIFQDLDQVRENLGLTKTKSRRWHFYLAAATILVAIGLLLRLGLPPSMPSKNMDTLLAAKDILPGSDQPTLTLSDGRIITLDETNEHTIDGESDAYVITNADSVRYDSVGNLKLADVATPQYHTLKTPIGKQIHLSLPDGSNVWLNAQSSLTYAINSAEKIRTVQLEGEAYFEIFSDAAKPFRVVTDKQTVTVLGTKFNINGYPDELGTTTTLVSGKVEVKSQHGAAPVLLTSGQQAFVDAEGSAAQVTDAHVDAAIAWTMGLFKFDGNTIDEVMRQLARWYDVDIIFEGTKPATRLWGEVHRNAAAETPLRLLEFFKFNHQVSRINGKPRITIFNH